MLSPSLHLSPHKLIPICISYANRLHGCMRTDHFVFRMKTLKALIIMLSQDVIYIFALFRGQKTSFFRCFLTPKSAPNYYMLCPNLTFSCQNHILSSESPLLHAPYAGTYPRALPPARHTPRLSEYADPEPT